MVLKEFIKIWKKDTILNQAVASTKKMLKKDKFQITAALKSFFDGKNIKKEIYAYDQEINDLETEVRKRILEHLSINPKQDVSSSLILLGVARAAERIGDMAKNIVDLAVLYKKKPEQNKYFKLLKNDSEILMTMIEKVSVAFFDSSRAGADEVVALYNGMTKRHKQLLSDVLADKELETKDAVVITLLSRHVKRTGANIKNIATTIANPFHKIRHRNKKLKV